MAVWHLGEGRHKKLRAVALPRKGELVSRCSGLTLSPNPTHLLPPARIQEKSVPTQAQPPAQGWALSLLGRGAGVGDVEATPPSRRPECNRQHNDGEEERAKNGESQVKRPRGHTDPVGREQPPSGEMLGEPQLHSGPETQAGGYKVWKFGLQVLVSIHHPGQLLASLGLCASTPHGARRPLFQPALSALATLKGPVIWALWSLKLGEVGWRSRGSRGTCPQAGRGGAGIEDRG